MSALGGGGAAPIGGRPEPAVLAKAGGGMVFCVVTGAGPAAIAGAGALPKPGGSDDGGSEEGGAAGPGVFANEGGGMTL